MTGTLAGLALWGWVVAASARWSWALAVRGRLPDEALFLTWFRGPAPVARGLVALAAAALTVAVVGLVAARPGTARGLAAGVVVAPFALALAGHTIVGPPYYGARAAFEVLRPGLERAAVLAAADPDADLYGGALLPWDHRPYTVDGRASVHEHLVFLPQWRVIPDDRGGFFLSPLGSPEGYDMSGMVCEDPVRLDDAWWACGMNPEPGLRW
ncbi:hypothetical protein [Cellulomonas cellasea]|uniref:Uncharacterized protein n=1 Tax=Cellulomonas cellasea TaxID=43670 RepID=A0A7W4UH41_9CELL|nr:hypothetical protein [Cellulomonas cellasea]MBB2924057.1 hypothetical protein [Cellulomonas cellasea]